MTMVSEQELAAGLIYVACGRRRPPGWVLAHNHGKTTGIGINRFRYFWLALLIRNGRFATAAGARIGGIHYSRLLILDDSGLAPMTAERRRGLLEIMDDRHGRGSTIVTSQLPVENWHEIIGDPTIADAILDRLVHNAYWLTLKGESLRKAAARRHNLGAEPAA